MRSAAFDPDGVTVVKWLASFALIGGYAATTLHMFPLNVALFLAGNVGWLIVALSWQDRALTLLQTIALFAMVAGLVVA